MKYTKVNYKESDKERDDRFRRSIFVMQEIELQIMLNRILRIVAML